MELSGIGFQHAPTCVEFFFGVQHGEADDLSLTQADDDACVCDCCVIRLLWLPKVDVEHIPFWVIVEVDYLRTLLFHWFLCHKASRFRELRSHSVLHYARSPTSGDVTFTNDSLSDVCTSTTVGLSLASASCSAGASCCGFSTRMPSQPMARAMAAWSKLAKSQAMFRSPWPCFTQPSAPLLKTTVTIGMFSSTAVISPFMPMPKPPSPQTATT